MTPNEVFVRLEHFYGAMAEQLGSGLQNRVHRCDSGSRLQIAGMAELVYAQDLKSWVLRGMRVRISLPAFEYSGPPKSVADPRKLRGNFLGQLAQLVRAFP